MCRIPASYLESPGFKPRPVRIFCLMVFLILFIPSCQKSGQHAYLRWRYNRFHTLLSSRFIKPLSNHSTPCNLNQHFSNCVSDTQRFINKTAHFRLFIFIWLKLWYSTESLSCKWTSFFKKIAASKGWEPLVWTTDSAFT